jgi:cell wall-associated NlpC family hydrolase
MHRKLLVAILVVLALVSACSDDDTPTPPREAGVDGTAPDVGSADTLVTSDSGLVPLVGPHAQVVVAVANIRKQPVPADVGDYSDDGDQETQVLYGDLLAITKEQGAWYQVGVLKQLWHDGSAFVPYPGWIQQQYVKRVTAHAPPTHTVTAQTAKLLAAADKSAKVLATLSVGTRLSAVGNTTASLVQVRLPAGGGRGWIAAADLAPLGTGTPTVSRAEVIKRAGRFLGASYYRGGYSAPLGISYQHASTGVDCSGLSGLTYRSLGVLLPRNADDQYRHTKAITLKELKRGDLLFRSTDATAAGVGHVMIYDGGERFIESTNAGKRMVRWSTFFQAFAYTLDQLAYLNGRASSKTYVLAGRVEGVSWSP